MANTSISQDEYIKAIKNNIIYPVFKFEMLNEDESFAYDFTSDVILNSGQIEGSIQNGERRQCSFKVTNYLAKWIPSVKTGFWVSSKFRIFCGLNINGTDYFPQDACQGVFVLKSVEADSSSGADNTCTINGVDKYGLLNGDVSGILDKVYETAKDEKFENVIKSLLEYAHDPSPIIVSHSFYNQTLPGQVREDAGQTIDSLIQSICGFVSANYYYDVYGHFVVEDGTYDIDDSIKSSVWDFSIDEPEYFGGTMIDDFTKIRNIVIVDVNNLQNNLVLKGRAENNNLSSPFCTQLCGKRVMAIQDNVITTIDQANQRANFELKKNMIMPRTYKLNTAYLPHIKENQVITLTDPNINEKHVLEKARMLVTGLTIPFGASSKMSIDASNVNELGFSVG